MNVLTPQGAVSIWHTVVDTGLGPLTLVRDDAAVRGLYYPHHWNRPGAAVLGRRHDTGFDDVVSEIGEYLAGTRRTFDVTLHAHGEAFHLRVWDLVARIGYGRTRTYGEIAADLGGGASAQEVGAAVGRNPLCVLVPCHRVVGNGRLGGYAGGTARKRRLLALEHHVLVRTDRPDEAIAAAATRGVAAYEATDGLW